MREELKKEGERERVHRQTDKKRRHIATPYVYVITMK